MTALIVIGIILGSLTLHFIIGSIAARLMSSKIAELSNKTVEGLREFEWHDGNGKKTWVAKGYQPSYGSWSKTGRSRNDGDIVFDENKFKSDMSFIRWFWFFGVPAVLNASFDNKMIEKYDPAVAERKQKALETRIAELEKELLDD